MPRIPTPLRLTEEDFDALVPDRPAAGPATRARLDLTSRMVRWARSVASRLEDQGIAVRAVAPGYGSGSKKGKGAHRPRVLIQESDPKGPKLKEKAVCLALYVDDKAIGVALEVPATAKAVLANLHATLEDDEGRTEILHLQDALPDTFRFGLAGEPGVSASEMRADYPSSWNALLERSGTSGRSLSIGWSVVRDAAIVKPPLVDERLEEAIVVLFPIFKLMTRADEASLGVRGRRKARASLKAKRPTFAGARYGDAAEDETSPFERGVRVRVLAGPFAGKVGVVKEVDGKGGAHVMLGLLATRIELKDLSASAGRRPTLASSHRKPLGLR
jgi:hypothetical protein